MNIQISLPVFEGPLELLLYLIRQNKIDIYDIPIALITKQYLEYIEYMKELDLEIASEFLVMAATLIYIKSKMLLPKQEGSNEYEEDPRQPLVNQLIEYEKFRQLAQILKERYKIWSQAFPKKNEKEREIFIDEVSIFDLITALKRISPKPEPKFYFFTDKIKVEDKMKEIIKILQKKKAVSFSEVFKRSINKLEIVVTFIALLELIKMRLVKAFQDRPFGDILITLMEDDNVSRSYIGHS